MTHRGGRGGGHGDHLWPPFAGLVGALTLPTASFAGSSLGFCLVVGFELAHGWPVQFQPIGVVDDAIEDGVGEGRLADDIVPLVEGELAGDERRAAAIAVLDDFHQIAPLVGDKPVRSPVIEDQQIGLDQGAEQAGEATVTVASSRSANNRGTRA